MKTTVTCPECKQELKKFQMSYENVSIDYHNAFFDEEKGYVDHSETDYSLTHPAGSDEMYSCPECFADITKQVVETEYNNWHEVK